MNFQTPEGAQGSVILLVLVVAIMSVLSGMWSYHAMGDFVKANKEELCRLLRVNRLPSYSTIRRVIKEASFEGLSQVLGHWKRPDLEASGLLNWLQLDGKALKGTVDGYGESNQDFINVVSMFLGQKKAVLQSAFFHNKQESEIKVVRKMIRQTDVKGVVFTADAMHAQKKTVRAIVKHHCHYVLKVKANQKLLYTQMQQVCTQPCRQSYTSTTYQKGRREVRKAEVFEAQGEQKKSWCKLKTFLKVTRRGTRQGHRYEWVSYYISDMRLGAREFLKGIRLHWSIENGLHWSKDVLFKEDECRTKLGNGAAILSLLRSFAISMLARTGSTISRMMRLINNKPEKIAELLE